MPTHPGRWVAPSSIKNKNEASLSNEKMNMGQRKKLRQTHNIRRLCRAYVVLLVNEIQ